MLELHQAVPWVLVALLAGIALRLAWLGWKK
jgi:hypothetical protein